MAEKCSFGSFHRFLYDDIGIAKFGRGTLKHP
jgi:hypothetical protein